MPAGKPVSCPSQGRHTVMKVFLRLFEYVFEMVGLVATLMKRSFWERRPHWIQLTTSLVTRSTRLQ